jgi:hypothetical protein
MPTIENKAVGRFFRHELVPLGNELRAAGKTFFPSNASENCESYYITRGKSVMSKQDFECGGCESVEVFSLELLAMWKSQGNEELTKLLPGLVKLADMLHEKSLEQDEEVSPFVYVMY